MAYEVEWAQSAVADLVEALDHISTDSPSYAATLAIQADRVALSLAELPHRGRRVREYGSPDVRELIVGRTYRLIYRVTSSVITVIALVHTARDLASVVADREPQ